MPAAIKFDKRSIIAICAIIIGLFSVLSVVSAPEAKASAYVCTWYGGKAPYIAVRNGNFCSNIQGDGTYVRTISGNFSSAVPGVDRICNFTVKADFYDAYGRWYTWRTSPVNFGCYQGGYANMSIYQPMQRGSVRVTLTHYGSPMASVVAGIG